MSEAKDGGPAFPTDNAAQVGSDTWHFAGMSLRSYFMAHAPAEPQPWFRPEMPEPPKGPTWEGDSRTADERHDMEGVADGFLRLSDIRSERARAFATALEDHRKVATAYHAEVQKQLYVQWPAAWADAMLAARGTS